MTYVNGSQEREPERVVVEREKSQLPVILGVVIVLVLVVFGLFWVFSGDGGSDDANVNDSSVTVEDEGASVVPDSGDSENVPEDNTSNDSQDINIEVPDDINVDVPENIEIPDVNVNTG